MVGRAKATEVALLEGNGRVKLPAPGDERGREIEPGHRDPPVEKIAGHVTRPAPEVPDRTPPGQALGEAIQQSAVERLAVELSADAAYILVRHRIVARLQGVLEAHSFKGRCHYPPCAWSRKIPVAISTIASARTPVRGSCRATNPTRRTSAVDVPPMISEEVIRNPRS